jgi:anti-anti-sigma factor
MAEPGLLDRLRPGDHVCLLVHDEPLRTRSLAAYMLTGLRDQCRVIYQGRGGEHVEAALIGLGVDVEAARRRDQLRITGAGSVYLRDGGFDPEATLESWWATADQTRAAGYRGLCAVGDMSWASRPMAGADRVPWYEEQVNRLFADGFARGVCLYDRRLFTDRQLRRLTGSHPTTVTPGSDPRFVPLFRALRTADPVGLRLEGEVDLSNRQVLRTVVDHLIEDTALTQGVFTVDLSDLRFADLAAVRILLRLGSGDRHGLRLVGCSGPMRRLLRFHGVGPAVELLS